MAGFLRRKSKNQEREPAPAAEPNKGPPTAPIFARLATSLTSSGRPARNPSHVAVSQPMNLGSPRAPTLRRTTQLPQLDMPRQGAQAETNAQTNAYSPQLGPQHAQVSRAASAAAMTPQRQAARLSRRVPGLEEKPLPVPVPDDDPPPAAVRTNEQTSLTQRSLVSRLSHSAHPSQPTASPPSAYGTRAQQFYKGRGVSIDSPRQVQESSVFDQHRSSPMSPPDSSSAFHRPLAPAPSPNFSLRRRMDDIRSSPRAEVNAGQHDLTSGSALRTVVPRHTIKPSHQTGTQQRNADDVLHRVATVDEHVPSAYSLREDVSTPESKLDVYSDPAPRSSHRNSYRSASPTHIHANSLGNTNGAAVHRDINLDRALPSRPATGGQDSENGDVFVDATDEIKPELRAEDASPEITLYRDVMGD
ncbi:hypothetical protein AX14_003795 [Amanita brunnescens Koide BX004]|nr:hypothetical protein AX14_003795 [Amanita brunnescens Koide BX004]